MIEKMNSNNKLSNRNIAEIVKSIPGKPGVYQFINRNNEIIYIGKAKNLKKRVSSYFNKNYQKNNKLKVLINNTYNINHIIVESETDALLLENNMIKKFQPKYNVNLKDDKTFPWICIKNESFPRIFITRKYSGTEGKFYGPYTSALTARTLLALIKKLYPLRTCSYNLSHNNLSKRKYKVCLEYHIGNCKGPCEMLQTEDDYNHSIKQINHILKGNLKDVLDYLEKLMNTFSNQHNFEKAQEIKEKIVNLKRFQMKSNIVNPKITDVDVISIIDDNKSAWVNFIKVVNGAVVQTYSVELIKKLDESRVSLLEFALTELRTRLFSNAKETVLPFQIENIPEGTKITVPTKGDKKKLLELSTKNAYFYMLAQKKQKNLTAEKKSPGRILLSLQKDLRLNNIPEHIECIDNSNIQGTSAVAACVVFRNGRPSKNEYRHFNIKSVIGANDPASMKEIVERRYKALLNEKKNLPQLLIVDGGKPQLNAAVKSLEKLKLQHRISVIGIAKKLEILYFPNDPVPLYLNKNSESLKLIQHLRNEAHRFGISFHRNKRNNNMINTKFIHIKGIGDITVQRLFKEFKSVDNIKNASFEMLESKIGKHKASLVKSYLKPD